MSAEEPVKPLPEPTDDLVVAKKKYKKIPRMMVDEMTGSAVELTKKQCTFLRHAPEMGTVKAAAHAKISYETAEFTLKLPAVQQYMRKILWQAGVTDEKIAQRIAEGLDATTQKVFCTKDGDIITGEERPDHEQRGKFIDRALKLKGLEKTPAEAPGGALPPGISLVGLTADDLRTLIDALRQPKSNIQDVSAE